MVTPMDEPLHTSDVAEDLVLQHRDYAQALTHKIARALPSQVDFDELLGFAQVGLVQAARAYDYGRGASFETFAYYRIRGAVFDGLRKMTWLPPSVRSGVQFQSGADEMSDTLASSADVSSEPDVLAAQFSDGVRTLGAVFLLSQASVEDQQAAEPIGTERRPDQAAAQREVTSRIPSLLEQLQENEAMILRQHYFEGLSLTECAKAMGVHKATTSRLHASAIRSLRTLLGEPPDQDG